MIIAIYSISWVTRWLLEKLGLVNNMEKPEEEPKNLSNPRKFDFSILPAQLRHSILEWLHYGEAHNLMKANKAMRMAILQRGQYPKYVDEINMWSPNFGDNTEFSNQRVLYLGVVYRNTDVQRSKLKASMATVNFPYGCESKLDFDMLNRIRSCKKLFLTTWTWDLTRFSNLSEKIKSTRLFSNLKHFKLFHVESGLPFIEMFLNNLNPNYIEELDLCINPLNDNDDCEAFYERISKKPAFRDCKYLSLYCSTIDKSRISKGFNAKHIMNGCDNYPELVETLEMYLRLGIPVNENLRSFEIRSQLKLEEATLNEVLRQTLAEIIRETPGVSKSKERYLDERYIAKLNSIIYYSSADCTLATFSSFEYSSPQGKKHFEEIREWNNISWEHFVQTASEREYFIVVFVQNGTNQPTKEHNVSIIWIPKL